MGYWTGPLSYQRGDGILDWNIVLPEGWWDTGLDHCLTRGVMGYRTGELSYQWGDGIKDWIIVIPEG